MSLPDWANATKLGEDAYYRKLATFRRLSYSLLVLLSLVLLALSYLGFLATGVVQWITLPFLFVLLTVNILQNQIIPPPPFPTYQRLAGVLFCIAGDLGALGKSEKADLKKQLDRLDSIISGQEPEFEKKDLVFGVAVSVLKKLTETRKRLSSASKVEIPRESLPTLQSNLQALANMIFQSKTINAVDIETVTDSLLANLTSFPLPVPVPLLRQVSTWLYQMSNRQTLLMEVMVSLFVGAFSAYVFSVGVDGGLIVFLGMVAFLDVVVRRLPQQS